MGQLDQHAPLQNDNRGGGEKAERGKRGKRGGRGREGRRGEIKEIALCEIVYVMQMFGVMCRNYVENYREFPSALPKCDPLFPLLTVWPALGI